MSYEGRRKGRSKLVTSTLEERYEKYVEDYMNYGNGFLYLTEEEYKSMTEEMITIPKSVYYKLLRDQDWLFCLEAAGVDNWPGVDEAMEDFRKGKYFELPVSSSNT